MSTKLCRPTLLNRINEVIFSPGNCDATGRLYGMTQAMLIPYEVNEMGSPIPVNPDCQWHWHTSLHLRTHDIYMIWDGAMPGRRRMIERRRGMAWDVTESSTKNSWNSCPPTLSMNPSIAGQLYLTELVIIDNSITVSVYIHLNLPIISFCYLGPSIGEKDDQKRSAQVEPDLATAAFKGSSFV